MSPTAAVLPAGLTRGDWEAGVREVRQSLTLLKGQAQALHLFATFHDLDVAMARVGQERAALLRAMEARVGDTGRNEDLIKLSITVDCPWCKAKAGEPCYIQLKGGGDVLRDERVIHLSRGVPWEPAAT
jgi:hypothetical protein